MIEWLLNVIKDGWARVTPLVEIVPYEAGVVLRRGAYHRTLAAGWHWKWPVFEMVLEATTCVTTTRLPAQSLTTKDGKGVVAAAIVKYEIKDVKPYLLDIFDQNDVLVDVTMGAIRKAVSSADYLTLMAEPPEKAVLDEVRGEVNKYGFKVHRLTFTDFALVRSIRLIQPHAKDLAN